MIRMLSQAWDAVGTQMLGTLLQLAVSRWGN